MRISDWSSDVCSSDLRLHLLGHVGGVFHHLVGPAAGIHDRVVAGLDPDFAATLADALVLGGVILAAAQLVPEALVFGALHGGRLDEDAVMLALHLGDRKSTRLNSSH